MNEILNNFRDLDITDKTILEEQINYVRNEYFKAIEAWENNQDKILKLKEEIHFMTVEKYKETGSTSRQISDSLKLDEDYLELSFKIEGFERGEKILLEKMNFLKSDLRVLMNTMYNRF